MRHSKPGAEEGGSSGILFRLGWQSLVSGPGGASYGVVGKIRTWDNDASRGLLVARAVAQSTHACAVLETVGGLRWGVPRIPATIRKNRAMRTLHSALLDLTARVIAAVAQVFFWGGRGAA